MKKNIQGNIDDMLEYRATKAWEDTEPRSMARVPILANNINDKKPMRRNLWDEFVKLNEDNKGELKFPTLTAEEKIRAQQPSDWEIIYKGMSPIERGKWNAKERKLGYNGETGEKIKSKSRGSGTMNIAWDLPSEKEEDLYGRYLDLIKSGDLLPGTSFEKFEKNLSDFDTDIISKKKRMDDKTLNNAIAKIDNNMTGIMTAINLGSGGPVKNRPKEPTTKKLNLADYFKLGMKITELTPQERELVNELVKKSLSYKKDN